MSKVLETGLVLRKESKFDKVRKMILKIFFSKEYFLEQDFEDLIKVKKMDISKIIIPREIGEKR